VVVLNQKQAERRKLRKSLPDSEGFFFLGDQMDKRNSDAEESEEIQNGGQAKPPMGKAGSVKTAIEFFETKLRNGEMKPTVGEYLRLLELEKELNEDELKEIKITWVEPSETES
jgi:hypothetical protein